VHCNVHFLKEKEVEISKQIGKRMEEIKPHKPNPVEQEGMPLYEHSHHAKHREDYSPKNHEEQ
jgi:hypothetical protein